MKSFIHNLKTFRRLKNATQEEVAQAIGVNVRTYQSYEYGNNEPSLRALVKMADFFKVTLDDLVGRF